MRTTDAFIISSSWKQQQRTKKGRRMTIKELDSGDGSLSAEAAADGSSQMQQSNCYFIRGRATYFFKNIFR